MASAKSRRYGQGGSKHKQIREPARANGKAFKKYPKGFDLTLRRLITTDVLKGTSFISD